MNFQEAEGEYKNLKAQLDAGALTEDQFEARLQAVMVQDQQGRWWTIGGATGQWYVHDGVNWVIGEPSAPTTPPPARPSGAAPEAKATPPPVPPVPSSENPSPGRKPWLWAVLGVLVVGIVAVLLGRLVPEPAANNAPKQTQAAPAVTPTASTAARSPSPVPPTATRPNLEAKATSQVAATDAAGRAQKETETAQVAGTASAATQTRSAQSKTAASATAAAPATATPTRPVSATQTATVKPTVYPLVACAIGPGGSFAGAWTAGNLRATLGCPTKPEASLTTSFELFANGFMVWRGDTRRAYVFYKDGGWQEFADTWAEGQPEYGCIDAYAPAQTPPTPHRGFGKVWCTQPGVRDRLGAALQDEIGNDRPVQDFENGAMVLIPERGGKPIVLLRDGSKWQEAP
jgi:hypothetical protein